MARRKVNLKETPHLVHEAFVAHLRNGIEIVDMMDKHTASGYISPSSLCCDRAIYYKVKSTKTRVKRGRYDYISAGETGTARHEHIQSVLETMNQIPDSEFIYINVKNYLDMKHENNELMNVQFIEWSGAEAVLVDKQLRTRFRVDGIVYSKTLDEYYLFEFKNQKSRKFVNKIHVDEAHEDQVTCYCHSLGLKYALVTYENRDLTTLKVPELYEVTDHQKSLLVSRILSVHDFADHNILPPKNFGGHCQFCDYFELCDEDFNYGED